MPVAPPPEARGLTAAAAAGLNLACMSEKNGMARFGALGSGTLVAGGRWAVMGGGWWWVLVSGGELRRSCGESWGAADHPVIGGW